MPNLSATLVVPTLNEEKYLPKLLESLRQVSTPLQIVIVDGNSEDGTVAVVEHYKTLFKDNSSLEVISALNRNISLQRNLGAARARYDVLIFCDADIVIYSRESYEKVVRRFVEKNYAAAAPRLIPIEPGFQFKIFYLTFYLIQRFLMLFRRPYFAGSYLLTKKDVFQRLGGFDVRVLLGEDVDYSLRAAKIGRCGLFNVPYHVSARRIIKYGYAWIVSEIPNLFRFGFTGHVIPDTIFYPFGEYGGQEAHHVTKNRGRIS